MPDDLITKRPTFDRARIAERGASWLFAVSFVLMTVLLVVWGGLFLFKRTLEANAASWKEQISVLENELRPDLLNQLITLSDRIAASREILTGHLFSSNALLLLERDTHPQVAFTSFQYAAESHKLELVAKAGSYRVVAEQVTLFEADPQVESVAFGGLSLDEKGLVGFKIMIIFKPSLLRLRP